MTEEKEKTGYLAFHRGKAFPLSAATTKDAYDQAAKHFGVPKRTAHRHIHLEEAPVGQGSNP
ncbi:hypothetical protein P11VFA_161 [Rhizobium phage P11VFA]|nr:hypothetical protein P11VFA_161 [Rhizobium phage P11VFA]